ncbi:MAG: hypothetical protein ACTSXK_05565 [Promethearchaeota archaeon]
MSLLKNISGFGNPITRSRRLCGGCIMLIGLILCIPSIAGLIIANNIYEKSYVPNSPGSQEFSPLAVNSTLDFDANGIMKAGNNYDIKILITVVGPNSDNQTGQISVKMTVTGDYSKVETASRTSFNGTVKFSYDKWALEEDLTQDKNLHFNFVITNLNDVSSASVEVRIYENPNRFLVNTITNVSLWLLIPGIIVICCGCIIAPPKKNR